MTRIKICGLTNEEDAMFCAQAGADALGFVLYEKSPRFVEPHKLKSILVKLPPFVTPVFVFVDPGKNIVAQALEAAPHALLQFHGNEPESFCCSFGRPYIKSFSINAEGNLLEYTKFYEKSACAFLLDTQVSGKKGGTGMVLPWERLPKSWSKPLILAGGLNPSNVQEAVAILKPWAVDVASGVEASPGKKDLSKIRAFIEAVRYGN